jgi:hypothetical protein
MRFEGLGDVAAERATSLISQIKEIFIAQNAVDFRKGFNGLLAECYNMEIDPYKDECVVFVHRWWRQVKVIFGDESGLFLVHRRFDGGALKATFAFLREPSFVCVTVIAVSLLRATLVQLTWMQLSSIIRYICVVSGCLRS